MKIDSIKDSIVLDHIKAGKSMDIYRYLGLDQLDCSVAIIKNVPSNKMGKKDILKIADRRRTQHQFSCHDNPFPSLLISVNVINFRHIYAGFFVNDQGLFYSHAGFSAAHCFNQHHIGLLIHKGIDQLHPLRLQLAGCQ